MALDHRRGVDDIGRQSPLEFSPEASGSKLTSNRSKASIRASLACVQCRSKHISNSLSDGWTAPSPVDANRHESLAGAFFDHFHLGHPILPPKKYFFKYVESDPNLHHFLLSVVDYCGALYTRHARLNDLREATYAAACGPLPFTVQSVQGLHLLAIIAFGESKFSHHVGFGNRSCKMAIELGMHRKSFADRTPDPVWAESCRRTWWYIKFQGMIRHVNEADPITAIPEVESDVDIPYSEEWQYQSGEIPLPISLSQYEREINLGRSEFPSLAFQIEICRIQADIALLCNEAGIEDEKRTEKIDQADSRLCDFLRRVPRWKMDVRLDSAILRERINALIRILKMHGEIWPLSKKTAEDIQAVADEYLPQPDELSAYTSSSDSDEWSALVSEATSGAPFFEVPTVGFDPYSLLNSQLECALQDRHESERNTSSLPPYFSTGGLVPTVSDW
ncbi:hypothetical protein GQX73_g3904 [Xylaria multiplex]|uniref:Xylanolytic transcriptional activator regulatory domain-containing protein n=1 Tax=Xylaria multiplex TaxID=323545 RepID=A0A7C8IYT9_9PEZI|nr:hypothetical protein GQX73_g3904 [Xylaria multiplex]